MADLTGLVIGFALGGAVLLHFRPQIEAMIHPSATPPTVAVVQPPAALPSAVRRVPVPRPAPRPEPEPLPDIALTVPPPAPLPQVIEPGLPSGTGTVPPPGTSMAGTGFFVADGLVLTAAHVVPDCRRAEIVSPFLRRSQVSVAARDPAHDIALLKATSVRAPAVLAIGAPKTPSDGVFLLGYPEGAGPLMPEEARGVLENDKLPREPAALTDPGQQVWMQAAAVRHGYSGGPIFDPRSGRVVGLVRGTVDARNLRAVRGLPGSGIAIGPGATRLHAFLENEAPGTEAFPADQWGDDSLTVVRHATVHVFCWR